MSVWIGSLRRTDWSSSSTFPFFFFIRRAGFRQCIVILQGQGQSCSLVYSNGEAHLFPLPACPLAAASKQHKAGASMLSSAADTCSSGRLHHRSRTRLDKVPVPPKHIQENWPGYWTPAVQGSRSSVAHPQWLFSPRAHPPDPREDSPTWRTLSFIELHSFYFRALVSPARFLIHPSLGRRFSQHPLGTRARTHVLDADPWRNVFKRRPCSEVLNASDQPVPVSFGGFFFCTAP